MNGNRLIIFVALSMLQTTTLWAQSSIEKQTELFFLPTKNGQLWGLVSDDGQLVMPPKYALISGFAEGPNGQKVSVVRDDNGAYGYIDDQGKEIYPTTLDNARALTEMGLARFVKDGKWGYLNTSGKIVIPATYKRASPMENGFAIVGENNRVFYINATGEVAIKGPFAIAKRFSKTGLAPVLLKENGKWGVIDTNGKRLIKPQFSAIREFSSNGLAPAATGEDYELTWGVINNTGDWVIKPKFESLTSFNKLGLAVFTDNRGHAGVINAQGEEIYKSRASNISLYSDCNILSHGYNNITFASLDGSKIDTLNAPSYDWFSGFREQCDGLAISARHWGWLKRDGSFTQLANPIAEPYTTHIDNAEIANLNGKFIPAITEDRKLVYVNREGEIALTTNTITNTKSDIFVVSDTQGKELWRATYPTGTLRTQHPLFFKPGNLEFGFDESWLSDIKPVVQKLLDSKPRYFEIFSGEPYSISSDEIADSVFGNIEMLAFHYLSEIDWGTYYFMESSADFSGQFSAIEKQLTKQYGRSFTHKDNRWKKIQELNYYTGDSAEARAWSISNSYLILDQSTVYGDGDITSTLKLSVLPKQRSKSATLEFDETAYELVETSDESDENVHAAVKALSQNSSNIGLKQEQANTVFKLVEEGSSISEYDYLWTLYALLSSAYPELEGGMPQENYIKVADTAINYLNNNGVGTWVFTESGQFQMEVFRNAGNGAAWTLRESDPEKALGYIEAAMQYAREEDVALNDTYVRVLLNLDQQDKAFAIIKTVLDANPEFVYFQEFHENQDYQDWLKSK